MDNMDFPSRTSIKEKSSEITKNEYSYLSEQARQINLDEVNFDPNSDLPIDRRPINTKIEKQKVYFWIRVYLFEEMNIEAGDEITINYLPSGEFMDTKFICYAKVGGELRYEEGEVVSNYNAEDNKKVLCLMVDEERINYNSDDIPYLRKLFKIGRYFEYELVRRNELELINTRTKQLLDYYDIEF
jgi:hypothetical protein